MPLNDFTGTPNGTPSSNGMPFIAVRPMPAPPSSTDDVPSCLIDYNGQFKDADPVMFRDENIADVIGTLISQRKPNALLVGLAGTGKTAIVEDLARRIANDDTSIPEQLKGTHIYELPLSSVVSNSGIVGELEKKLEAIIDFISNPDNDAILFIDEIHQLMSDSSGTYQKIAQILKPALARGGFRVIGATTSQEARSFMRDPAMDRRFTRVIVDELTPEQTTVVLETIWPTMYKHYAGHVQVDATRLSEIVAIADELFSANSHRPDNAITLLDRSCADAVIRQSKAAELMPDKASRDAMRAMRDIPLRIEDIRQVALKYATGHAVPDTLDVEELDHGFEKILGQDKAIARVRHALMRRDKRLFPEKKPYSFLFAGPSGTGKTETARIISQTLFHEEPIMLNMCEYDSPEKINRILGSAAGYVGSDWNNELPFDSLDANPYRLVLLDEIEKAHTSVQRLFMSVLEDGCLTTSAGKVVDFSHTIVIATTNAAHSTGTIKHCGFGTAPEPRQSDLISDMKAWFDAELMNRFSDIVTFDELDRDTYRDIIVADYARERERIVAEHPGIDLPDEISADELDRMVETTYIADFGARPAHRAVVDYIFDNA